MNELLNPQYYPKSSEMRGQPSNHTPYPSEALGHDLARFTLGRNFFPRSSLVVDLNGKGKLGGEEDAPPREFVNSGPSKGGRIVL